MCVHSGWKNAAWDRFLNRVPGTGAQVGWGEASWDNEGPVQQGGLQMDWGFQHTYGAEFVSRYGNAGRWPVRVQLLVAWRGYHGYNGYAGRGWSPWPATARACGLLK